MLSASSTLNMAAVVYYRKSMNFTRLQDFTSNKILNFTVTAIRNPNHSDSLKFPFSLDKDKHFVLSVEICEI